MTIYSASPAKLRSGEWGARIQQSFPKGAMVTVLVTTKAGKTWTTTGTVIWTDGNVSLLATDNGRGGSVNKTRTRSKVNFEGWADLHASLPKNSNYHGGHVKTVQ